MAFDSAMLALPIATGSGVIGAGIKASKGGKAVPKISKAASVSRAKFFSRAPQKAVNFQTKLIGKKFVEFSYEVPAKKAGPPARAVYKKAVTVKGKTVRVIKDTFSKNNKLMHRKFKYPAR